ncbi:RAD55 family ATPase [Halostella litorea]|uniref:RAD55 family ATPase n=1 Tax=Halostella litorea TaxID=2528831 RepID=UPI001091B9F3|nr:recombinase RecA [Halostella litorea]
MYSLDIDFPTDAIAGGTNLLVVGPSMSGKRGLVLDVLADGYADDDGVVVVTTQNGPDEVHDGITDRLDVDSVSGLGVVDCTGQEGPASGDDRIRRVSSPRDLTGIGMESSDLIDMFTDRGYRPRTAFDSLSQLLMYADVKTVFRFLHIFTGRIGAADALGLYTLDSEAHDEQTAHTIRQLFDGMIQTKVDDDGRAFRVRGLPGADDGWTRF